MTNIMVTGGSGFIGTILCRKLCNAGYTVFNIDRVINLNGSHFMLECDIGDNSKHFDLAEIFNSHKFESIIHLAADHEVGRSVTEPGVFFQNNISHTIRLLNLCVKHQVKNFIFSSSSSVYGNGNKMPVTEDSPTNPESSYGETKLAIERLLPYYETAYGLKTIALRYFNAAGAAKDLSSGYTQDPASHLIPIIAKKVVHGGEFIVNGSNYPTHDGTCVRDYTHVEDIASAHISALDKLRQGAKLEKCYNIGRGEGTSILEILQKFQKISKNCNFKITMGPARPGDPAEVWASNNLAMVDLNWEPAYDIEDIITHAIAWERIQSA